MASRLTEAIIDFIFSELKIVFQSVYPDNQPKKTLQLKATEHFTLKTKVNIKNDLFINFFVKGTTPN